MGYRSQIASIIYDKKEIMDKFKADHADIIKILDDEFNDGSLKYISSEDYDFIYLNGNDWKWYQTFKEVKAWEELMDLADKEKLSVEFVRIGDDYDDVEVDYRNDHQYYLTPIRTIEASF
jgi:hypothetical protein